jgi:hypothetical protein
MAQPRILIREDDRSAQRARSAYLTAPERAWSAIGRLGLLVGIVGVAGAALEWYPPSPQNAGSVFAALVASVGQLPLVTIGFLTFLVAAIAQRRRRAVRWAAVANLAIAAAVLAMILAFGALAPRTYALASESARLGLRKEVLRTVLLGIGLGFAQLAAGIGAWRMAGTRTDDRASA